MMMGVREFLKTTGGKAAAIGVVLIAVIIMLVSARNNLGRTDAAAMSQDRNYICAETGKSFSYTVRLGDTIPVQSPHSGKKTGYPAEFCYWTADGKIKDRPTLVLLNQHVGKPGPTFCPDCGRAVSAQNPPPIPGSPPPTQQDYEQRRSGSVEE